mmetsp:Transcript_27201/g.68073  ORF Transcript_27201/g.68073 Transcript_27201/m.68073 type:complete len:328 (-) Transcript_27201:53-1036(-)|eukprot:CAMPEP_0181361208 /NCGR_PEP_ID=MMETSP1106-20121128/7148_1 /TAXON_ID=81844 /ORGANISM="Mantoniella antarctica, Strain SL-175" /LENGTH=327 /DNA_ID=CAMNT_0023474675 /DNA_START=213 /DNA_END=1196 /DNA_ORIENTATION=+
MDLLKHKVHTAYKGVAESLMSTRTTSAFIDKGVVSPEEFVIAGDFLVAQCPTWSWQGGEPKNARSFLPLDKQFLVTRNVPCLMRAAAMEEYAGGEKMLDGDDDGWVEAGGSGGVRSGGVTGDDDIADIDDVPDIGGLHVDDSAVAATAAAAAAEAAVATAAAGADAEDDGDIPDMDDFVDLAAEAEEDEASALPAQHGAGAGASGNDDHILKTRTYDLSITYDKYYQTPRVWLNGYDERRQALDPKRALEDISAEHAQKTVTIDPHPHTSVPSASIHPCKHGPVMKKLTDMMAKPGTQPSVEHYLFVFLKFIASVVPTIEYDYTLAI